MDEPLTSQQQAARDKLQHLTPRPEDQVRRLNEAELQRVLHADKESELRAVLADAYLRLAREARENTRE